MEDGANMLLYRGVLVRDARPDYTTKWYWYSRIVQVDRSQTDDVERHSALRSRTPKPMFDPVYG